MRILTLFLFVCIFTQSCEKNSLIVSEESIGSSDDELDTYRSLGFQVFTADEVDEILRTPEGISYLEVAEGNKSKAFANYSYTRQLKEAMKKNTFDKSDGDEYLVSVFAQYTLPNGSIVTDNPSPQKCVEPNCSTITMLAQVEGAPSVTSGLYFANVFKNFSTIVNPVLGSYGSLDCGFPHGFGGVYTFGRAELNVNPLTGAITASVSGDYGCGTGIDTPVD